MMHDTHCHLDLYPDPYQVASATEKARIATVAVTNLPSAYFAAKPHMRRFQFLKLAVGLHPLLAHQHSPQERRLFENGLQETRYVGEVGLDFSTQGIKTKEEQIDSFEFVLALLHDSKRFVTLHSRRAESKVLELLAEYQISPVVFHWYSGSLRTLDAAVVAGHFFSVNTSMVQSKNGLRIIDRIPKDRILVETDGPFIKIGERAAVPADGVRVVEFLAQHWDLDQAATGQQLERNLVQCLRLST